MFILRNQTYSWNLWCIPRIHILTSQILQSFLRFHLHIWDFLSSFQRSYPYFWKFYFISQIFNLHFCDDIFTSLILCLALSDFMFNSLILSSLLWFHISHRVQRWFFHLGKMVGYCRNSWVIPQLFQHGMKVE